MELEDYKKLMNSGEETLPESEEGLCIQDLYERVNEQVRGNVLKVRKHIAFLIILTLAYLSLALSGELQKGLLIIASGFIAGAIYLFFRIRSLPDDYYCLPLVDFIRIVRSRLEYFSLADWLVIPPVLVVLGIGGGIHLVSRLSIYTDAKGTVILLWVLFYIGLCIFGYYAGRKDWEKKHRDLLKYLKKFNDSL